MEVWDVRDAEGRLTGRKQIRGTPMAAGDFHLVVSVWIVGHDGRVLLTRRHPDKHFAGLWECTGGAVLAGEESAAAALREVREEIGVELPPGKGRLLGRYVSGNTLFDHWLFVEDVDLGSTRLQESEVTEIRKVDGAGLRALFASGEMVPPLSVFLESMEGDPELSRLLGLSGSGQA